jgi:hypothetical protein
LFIYSIFYLSKPSETLDSSDIDDIRHRRRPPHNGNDWRYKGKRSTSKLYMGGA